MKTAMESYYHLVEEAFEESASFFGIKEDQLKQGEKIQILENSRSILMARDGLFQPKKGSFTKSFIDGELFSVLELSDPLCIKCLPFFAYIFKRKFVN
ncbi:hypothetical protein EBU94_04775 [bacterium]|nr:hypothetical protein [bacterium]